MIMVIAYFGKSAHHCPLCDGYFHVGKTIAVYGKGERGSGMALELSIWTDSMFPSFSKKEKVRK